MNSPARPPVADPNQLLDINDLARLLRRSSSTISSEITKQPHKLPPRIKLPGSRRVLWRRADVDRWLDESLKATTENHYAR